MRKVIVDLIESVRQLKIGVSVRDDGRHVRIEQDAGQFKTRLLDVHDALAAVDADGALSREQDDPQKLREGIEGLLRWVKLQGLPVDGALEVLAESVGGEKAKKKSSGYDILPSFDPKHVRKKRSWKPALRLPGSRLSTMRIGDHARLAEDARQVVTKMGAAAPTEDPAPSPMMRR